MKQTLVNLRKIALLTRDIAGDALQHRVFFGQPQEEEDFENLEREARGSKKAIFVGNTLSRYGHILPLLARQGNPAVRGPVEDILQRLLQAGDAGDDRQSALWAEVWSAMNGDDLLAVAAVNAQGMVEATNGLVSDEHGLLQAIADGKVRGKAIREAFETLFTKSGLAYIESLPAVLVFPLTWDSANCTRIACLSHGGPLENLENFSMVTEEQFIWGEISGATEYRSSDALYHLFQEDLHPSVIQVQDTHVPNPATGAYQKTATYTAGKNNGVIISFVNALTVTAQRTPADWRRIAVCKRDLNLMGNGVTGLRG